MKGILYEAIESNWRIFSVHLKTPQFLGERAEMLLKKGDQCINKDMGKAQGS